MGVTADIVIIMVAALLGAIIAGGGRVGQHIAQVLTKLELSFVIIELNHQRMKECQQANFPVIYGGNCGQPPGTQ